MKKTLATILLLSTVFVVSCKDDEPEAAPEHGTPSIRYQVTGSVTGKTDYLINNDVNSSSSKNKKARELGIPVISEAEFLKMTGENELS